MKSLLPYVLLHSIINGLLCIVLEDEAIEIEKGITIVGPHAFLGFSWQEEPSLTMLFLSNDRVLKFVGVQQVFIFKYS